MMTQSRAKLILEDIRVAGTFWFGEGGNMPYGIVGRGDTVLAALAYSDLEGAILEKIKSTHDNWWMYTYYGKWIAAHSCKFVAMCSCGNEKEVK